MLYTLARRGEVVEREPRRVTIHELSISDFADGAFTMKCLVSKGTYIRVLAEDIGRRLASALIDRSASYACWLFDD
mgnify:CR=1 FL=1